MFDILVYLYETYYRPETCPDAVVLAKKLSAVGFDDEEIVEALDWLSVLTDNTQHLNQVVELDGISSEVQMSSGFRIYTEQESHSLGLAAIGFIQYLINANVLNAQQREIVVERALALDEEPVPLDKLKVVVLMVLWSQGKESEMWRFDDLLLSDEETAPRLHH